MYINCISYSQTLLYKLIEVCYKNFNEQIFFLISNTLGTTTIIPYKIRLHTFRSRLYEIWKLLGGQWWRSGTRYDCKTDWLWVRSPLEEIKYLFKFIFPFLRSSVEAKRGAEFCHSTRNASRIRQKVGNGVS